jgi:hypothetical protein
MNQYFLITGASSGIGAEMAKILAAKKENLILTARREYRLVKLAEELQDEFGIEVHTISADLSEPGSDAEIVETIQNNSWKIKGLINNAGFGDYGLFQEGSHERSKQMVQLNISALVGLTHQFLPEMIREGEGYILNVASILSFFPFPRYAVYAATKAFVLSFSESLYEELRDTGVTVSALCPGPTETEFTSPEMLKTNAYRGMKQMNAEAVAEAGINGLFSGKNIVVPGLMNKLLSQTPRFSPRSLTRRINNYMSSQ